MKLMIFFLVGAFLAGGLPSTRRLAVQRSWLGVVVCAIVAVGFLSLRVLL